MLPFLPLIAGIALGAAGVVALKNKKTQEKLTEGKEYLEGKFEDGKKSINAIKECVKEKITTAQKPTQTVKKPTTTTKKQVPKNESKSS